MYDQYQIILAEFACVGLLRRQLSQNNITFSSNGSEIIEGGIATPSGAWIICW